jgi:hypothetical protein
MDRACSTNWAKSNAYRILVGKPEEKRPLGRPRRRWVDNRDRMGLYGLDRSGSGEGPVEGSFEHGNEPSGSIICWEVLEWLHNWRFLKKGSAPRESDIYSYFHFFINTRIMKIY